MRTAWCSSTSRWSCRSWRYLLSGSGWAGVAGETLAKQVQRLLADGQHPVGVDLALVVVARVLVGQGDDPAGLGLEGEGSDAHGTGDDLVHVLEGEALVCVGLGAEGHSLLVGLPPVPGGPARATGQGRVAGLVLRHQ